MFTRRRSAPSTQHEVTIRLPGLEDKLERLLELYSILVHQAEKLSFSMCQANSFKNTVCNQKIRRNEQKAAKREKKELEALRAEGRLYDVWLLENGPTKIQVIKVIRELTNLGLKEAKDISDCVPSVVMRGLDVEHAHTALSKLTAGGGKAEMRKCGG